MQSSLGIYIEDNVIKYAKLQKDKELIRVEAYNVAFYDNDLKSVLNRIISETYSYKVPISINIPDEIYNSFEISSLISKQDVKKVINMEYEMMCAEKGYNARALEQRYMLAEQKENPDKQKVINIMTDKKEITKRLEMFEGKKVNTITPISTSIANLPEINGRKNIVIVNIEEKTKVTTIIEGQFYQFDVIEEGMQEILQNINKTENSMSKSYEVCKNMNVYTRNSSELYTWTNEYDEIVMSTLDKIITEVKKIMNSYYSNVENVYITGMGACINNVDLYFQENIPQAKCEILKPYFVSNESFQTPIKEYIEVNSAIALALDGLGMVNKNVNFAKSSGDIASKDISLDDINSGLKKAGKYVKQEFKKPLDSVEKLLLRGTVACVMAMIVFIIFGNIISVQIKEKNEALSVASAYVKTELEKIEKDIKLISGRTETYKNVVEEITNPSDNDKNTSKRVIAKDAIPNLLNRIMFVIPKRVKITSIKNTTSDHIVIEAEAEKYEQLGYFKAVLTTNGILKNVKSTSGNKTGTAVQVTIEGDLP